jgi:NitT/TauT family transport system substrate-binding protein
VDWAELSFPDQTAGLANGSVDAALSTEPLSTLIAERGLATKWHQVSDYLPGASPAFMSYAPAFMSDQPEAARRFMAAYLRGARDYYGAFTLKDPAVRAQVIPVLTQATNYRDPAQYERYQLPAVNPDGHINVAALDADYRWYVAQGLIGDGVNVAQLVDGQFVDYALRQLGPYAP